MDFIGVAWVLGPLVYGVMLGWAWFLLSLTPAEFKHARVLIWLAPILLVVVCLMWGITTDAPALARVIVMGLVGALVFIGTNEALRWVRGKEQSGGGLVNFVLLQPANEYEMVWDPGRSLQIITRPRLANGEEPPAGSRLPCFRLKNIGSAVAEQIEVSWKTDLPKSAEEFFPAAERFAAYKPTVAEGMLALEATTETGRTGWSHSYAESGMTKLPYLAPTIDNENYTLVCVDAPVWALMEAFLITRIPVSAPILSAAEAAMRVVVTWEAPIKGEASFKVPVRCVDIKPRGTGEVKISFDGEWRAPPEFMSHLKFEVTKDGSN